MERFVATRCDGLAVADGRLYWKVGCGGELQPARSVVESCSLTRGSRVSHYAPADCQPDRVASMTVAVDNASIYWLTGDGHVVTVPVGSSDAAPRRLAETETRRLDGWPGHFWITLLGDRIYWNEGPRIFSIPKTGGPRSLLTAVAGARGLLGLTSLDGARLVCLAEGQLIAIPVGDPDRREIVATGVSCFAVGRGRLVWGARGGGSATSTLRSRAVEGGDTITHHTTRGELAAVAVDAGGVYAHEVRNVTGGPIVRAPLDRDGATDISEFLLRNPSLVAGQDGYLYWTDFNSAIFRLATGAPPVRPPGSLHITGVHVTQGVQTSDQRIPLLAWRRTFVRVYVRGDDDGRPWAGVTARLTVEGSARAHTPLARYAITAPVAGSDPRTVDDSFVFELDPEEMRPGSRSCTVHVVPPPGRPTSDPGGPTVRRELRFLARRDGSPVSVGYYGIRYRMTDVPEDVQRSVGLSGPTWPERPWSAMVTDRRNAEQYLPVAHLALWTWPGNPVASFPYTGPDVPNDRQAFIRGRNWARSLLDMRRSDDPVQRLVVLQPEMNDYNGHCSSLVPPAYINLQSGPEPGNTLAHELGHSLGMAHTQFVGGPHDDDYPRQERLPDGSSGPRDGMYGPEIGLAVFDAPVALPGTAPDGTPALGDLMSYRHLRPMPSCWASPYTYCKMMKAASGGEINPAGIDGFRG